MTNRAGDWFAQAQRYLEQALSSSNEGRHEWACFAAQQSAEKAVKALHLHLGQEAWGHVVARLLRELPLSAPELLVEEAKVLDNFYVATRYANGHAEGARLSSIMGHCKARRPYVMPVRSLHSSVLRWPSLEAVDRALRRWAQDQQDRHPELARLGYFGSYARGDWGVGSDLDLVAVVDTADEPFERRALTWDLHGLPVPAEIIVYTVPEWKTLQDRGSGFARALARETVWIVAIHR